MNNLTSIIQKIMLIACAATTGICQQLPLDSHSLKLPSQKPDTNITPAAYRLALVQRIFELGNPTANAIQLHRMGDEAALDLVKIIGTTSLTGPQINTILQIIHLAFEKTSQLLDQANLQPKATTVLLQYLGTLTQDQAIQQQINATRQFALTAAASPAKSN